MLIKGFQKLTLLDYPGKTACTVFTGGCNYRCPFCHNAGLVTKLDTEIISEGEVLSHLKKRQGILDGVAISGGEPLLQGDIEEFLQKIKELGYTYMINYPYKGSIVPNAIYNNDKYKNRVVSIMLEINKRV